MDNTKMDIGMRIFREDTHLPEVPLEFSYAHGACAGPLVAQTIGSLLTEAGKMRPDLDAFHFPEYKQRITYLELLTRTDAVACGFLALGIKKGDRVIVIGCNGVDWLIAFLALATIGAIYNGPYLYSPKDQVIRRTLKQLECMPIVLLGEQSSDLAVLSSVVSDMSIDKDGCIHSDLFPELKYIISEEKLRGTVSLSECISRGSSVSAHTLAEAKMRVTMDDHVIILTSTGTTGNPKYPTWSHFAMVNCGSVQIARNFPKDQDVVISTQSPTDDDIYPVFNTVTTLLAHSINFKLVFLPDVNLLDLNQCNHDFLKTFQDYRVTMCFLYPHIWMSCFINNQDFKEYNLSCLKHGICAGWKVDSRVSQHMFQEIPGFSVSLSSSEYWPITNNIPADDWTRKAKTVGFVVPHTEIKLVDTENRTVRVGETGELYVRGPAMFSFYWGEPELTQEAKDGAGWYHTGDMCKMNADGFVTYVGRKTDAIRFKIWGDIVYPGYIEDAAKQMDGVAEVKVVGVDNELKGSDICLCVVMKGGYEYSEEDIFKFLNNQLTSKDIPDFILQFESFPKLGSRKKVSRLMVEQMAIEKMKKLGLSKTPEDYAKVFA